MGGKMNDLFGARGCSDCHAEVDRVTQRYCSDEAALYHLQGVIRTQQALIAESLIKA